MEIFDIVDELGNPTGETVERNTAHDKGIRHRTAHIWVVRKTESSYEFLLQKRALNKESFPGCYDTSSAGHIHAGDEPLISALRELEEELSIKAKEEDLHFADTFKIQYTKVFNDKPFSDNEISFVYIYNLPVDIETLTLQKEELDSVKWFELKELESKLNPRDPEFCVPIDGFNIAKNWCLKNM